MDPRIAPLAEMLKMNTRLYRNCLAGLTDEQAKVRPTGTTNSAAFVAAHLVDSRYYLLSSIGGKGTSPLKGAKGGFNKIDDVSSYPPLAEIQKAWTAAGKALAERFDAMKAAELDAPLDAGFPIDNQTLLGLLTFHHPARELSPGAVGAVAEVCGVGGRWNTERGGTVAGERGNGNGS